MCGARVNAFVPIFFSLHFFAGVGGVGGVMEWETSKIFASIIVAYTASGRTRADSKAVGV